ncbi:MAG: hypothetical protein IJ869_02830 [Clostridiales bacterium]|nr:hypothetical protein [Clostridiales bacterium]HAW15400.1 hypothetical protein [Clostridiales bacterium]
MNDCLVYFFTGFLDAGKTTFISSWLGEENFRDKKILILATEEGEEEYDKDKFPGVDLSVVTVEPDEVDKELMFDIEKKFKPDVIFMEWNGSVSPSEFFEKVDVPKRWALAAAIVIVDASTYSEYYRNMQTIFADYYRFCDNVIFNRVDPEVNNIPKLRGSVKSLNPGMNITFLGTDGDMIDIGDHLPYDLKNDPCVIDADDFGLFYTDALDNVERYNGKRVTLIGRAVIFRQFKNRAFALQRQAYTCCANDIGQINLLCFHEYGSGFPVGQWLKVTGRIRYFEDKQGGQTVAVPCLEVDDYSITSAPATEIIYFS